MQNALYFELQNFRDAFWSQRLEGGLFDPKRRKGKTAVVERSTIKQRSVPTQYVICIVPHHKWRVGVKHFYGVQCFYCLILYPDQNWTHITRRDGGFVFYQEKNCGRASGGGILWRRADVRWGGSEWNDFTVCNDTAGVHHHQHRWQRRLKSCKKAIMRRNSIISSVFPKSKELVSEQISC